jgi:hypothetical protein
MAQPMGVNSVDDVAWCGVVVMDNVPCGDGDAFEAVTQWVRLRWRGVRPDHRDQDRQDQPQRWNPEGWF